MNLRASLWGLSKRKTECSSKDLKNVFYLSFHTYPFLTLSSSAALNLQNDCFMAEIASELQSRHLFDGSFQPELAQCNHLIFEYSRNGCNREAFSLFKNIRRLGLPVDSHTFSCVLKVCGGLVDEVVGRQVHSQCVKLGFVENVCVGTSLLDMYMKTKNVEDGRKFFDQMGQRNVLSWTSLLAGYGHNGLGREVIDLFIRMQRDGIEPNRFTFSAVLRALAEEGMVENGIQVHTLVIKYGSQMATYACNSLINMYLKSGAVRDARIIFDRMPNRDAVTWNCIISGFVTNRLDLEAFEAFYQMRLAGVKLTQKIFSPVIKLCANNKELSFLRQLHCWVLKTGFVFDHSVRTALMVAYSKCSKMEDAFKIFSMMQEACDVVSWTAMISGHLQNGGKDQAIFLFIQMNREGFKPNHFTYSTILTAQPDISPFQLHAQVIKTNFDRFPTVGTALLDAYVKLGYVEEAAKIFEVIDEKDIVTWSAMLAGYAAIGDSEDAVKLFIQLGKQGIRPNEYTFSSVVNACAAPTAPVEQGRQVHACAIKLRLNNALCVSSALVTMYSKRGNIESAYEVFKRQVEQDLVSWNSMISGYAQHGHAQKALKLFDEMQRQNLEMDGITFIGVISACTHAGLVDEGQKYFDMMVKDHQICPTMEHYSCMVDLYSRAGMLEKAMETINGMPFPAAATVWRILLAACCVHRNLELGKHAAEQVISLQPQDSAAYVLLSNLCAATGDWQERSKVRRFMDERKVKKEPGYSWIEVKNKTHSFLAGDCSHPMSDDIYLKLEELKTRLKDVGYQPDTTFALRDIDDEQKEALLSRHSERLALAFGLISTPPGTTLQIVKNLRVCGDCHAAIKLISLLEEREIVVRDTNRFHHFKGGTCSCGDYW